MKRPYGITFEVGCADDNGKRKWFVYLGKLKLLKMRPSLDGFDARYGGFKFDVCIGSFRRPVPKFWKPEFWSQNYMVQEPATNCWNSGNHWFVIPAIPFIGLFVCLSYGAGERQPGLYFGFKTYEVNAISQGLGRYDVGDPETALVKFSYPEVVAWGRSEEKGNINLCLSASIRLTDMVD